jgi:hypothetical protein
LITDREWLFADNNYHVDTTHLSSVVRIARIVSEPESLAQAVDLCAYGAALAPQFQFTGDPPFERTYAAHELFFAAQLGARVEEAVEFFTRRATEADPLIVGTGPAETLVVLCARLRRWDEALAAAARWLPPGTRTGGFAPSLLELSRQAGNFAVFKQLCRERSDLLNYAAALAAEAESSRDNNLASQLDDEGEPTRS